MTVEISNPPAAAASGAVEQSGGVTLRAVLLSLGLALFFGYIIPIVDMKMRNTFLGATHLPPGAIAVLLILLLAVNPLLHLVAARPARRLALLGAAAVCGGLAFQRYSAVGVDSLPFWLLGGCSVLALSCVLLGTRPLSRNETLTVYISCLFSALVPGHGAENVFVVNLIGPFYYASRENNWLSFLEPYLKPWMTPALAGGQGFENDLQAREVVSAWFLGDPGGQVPWGAWLVPLAVWGTFIFLMYVMMACLCVMLRKQWAEREALAFPLLRLPMELTEDMDRPQEGPFGRFFRNPVMWVGFGLVVFVQLLRGLNLYYPDVPTVPLSIDTSKLFTEAPWNQIGGVPIIVWPAVLGIAYLLTSEVSFSFWFFFWFMKFQLIMAYYFGYMPSSLPNAIGSLPATIKTFAFYQHLGVFLAYVGIVLYTGREHLKFIARRGLGRAGASADEAEEAMSYPWAFWGFLATFGLLVAWTTAAGVALHLALVIWVLYLVIIIALTRIIAEAGLLFVQQGWLPVQVVGQITNSGPGHWLLAEKSLPAAGMIQGSLMTDLRGFIMPSFLQGFKLAHDRRIPLRPLLGLMVACTLITLVMGVYMNVKLGYSQGGLFLDPWYNGEASRQPARVVESLSKGVRDASYFNLTWVGVGMALTYGMMLARSRMAWFPLHPLGLLVAHTYPISSLWFSIFLGWMAKVLITRFGGTDSYRMATPLFLGLALGDVAMMLFWLCVDGWMGKIGHKLMPG